MSENAMKLANIQTMIVGERKASKELRLSGKVQVDERKLYAQTTHIPGRIEQLNINFTGDKVNRGQTLAMVYSPELMTAQAELLQANNIRGNQPELFEAAKQKLANWKIGEGTIDKILNSEKLIQRFPISADVSGIVVSKEVDLGDYVERGTPLYEIADLSSVWVLFDVYESDLPWVQTGNKVTYTVQSFPGETFEGTISFIDPLINAETRVASARVEVKNADFKLKPEMFVSGTINTDLGPTLGNSKEIVIPKSAVMWTGERSIVYLRENVSDKVDFILREVVLGPSLGDAYVIRSGLRNGDEIVVNGTFTVDAASQLAGKPSMMNPEGTPAMNSHNHGSMEIEDSEERSRMPVGNGKSVEKLTQALQPVLAEYLAIKEALSNDQVEKAIDAGKRMLQSVEGISFADFSGESQTQWEQLSDGIRADLRDVEHFNSLGEVRTAFLGISNRMVPLATLLKQGHEPLYILHCPMADSNKGADWLSTSKEINNPYYGKSMSSCGEVKREIK
jgi:Cu(I)/Ag(I) efflux system membrane fusion protein